MRPATVRAILRRDKIRDDGTAPIFIRITQNRRSRYLSTGLRVRPAEWNARKDEIRQGHELADAYNAKLNDLVRGAEEAALKASTAAEVKTALQSGSGSLIGHLERYISRLEARTQFWERRKFETLRRKLVGCFGGDVAFADIDRHALHRFERYLREEHDNGASTVRKEMERLRRVYRDAMREGVIRATDDPFLTYDPPKAEPPARRKLTLEEVRTIEAAALPNATLEAVRDAFVFQFYAAGIRIGDLLTLEQTNIRDGRLQYRMLKTGHVHEMALPAPALRIADRYADTAGPYLFPFLEIGNDSDPVDLRKRIARASALYNLRLKEVAKAAGISSPDTVSSHVARHSWADHARKKSGNVYAVSKALGHTSLRVTQQYLASLDRDAIDELNTDLWG